MEHPPQVRGDEQVSALIAQLRDLVHAMNEHQGEGIKAPRVVQFAAAAVPGAEHAAISLTNGTKPPETVAATGELPLRVDKIQYEVGEGPCMQALIQSDLVWSDDLTIDRQWPLFAPRAVEATGVRSMASYRLFLSQDRRGALNFYATTPGAFDRLALGVGAIFASYASLTLLNELHQDKIMNLGTRAGVQPRDRHRHRHTHGSRTVHSRPGLRPAPRRQPTHPPQTARHRRPRQGNRRPARSAGPPPLSRL